MSTGSRGKDLRGALVTIRAARASLRASEQRVADYVLEHAGDVVHNSVTALARDSGTSEATIMRFCRALGYRGFPELKMVLTRDLARQDGQLEAAERVTADDDVDAVARHVFQALLQALVDTMELQQVSELARAAAALAGAGRIILCGIGGAAAVTGAAAHKFGLIGLQAQALGDTALQRVAACQLGPGDVAVGVSHSGETREVGEAIALAAAAGAITIGITHRAGSPLSQAASIVLYTAGADISIGDQPVASHLAEMALVDALFVAVALRRSPQSVQALRHVAEATGREG